MPRIEQSTVRNRLLAGLPPDAFALLAGHLTPVALELSRRAVQFCFGKP
jgi:hypothetical protein